MSEVRQLIVFCDGTNNNVTGNRTDTNVLKLQRCLVRDAQQLVFYDPGVGNAGITPGATWDERLRARFDRLQGLAFGTGVYENIGECYSFLARHYQSGDQIYLFGFSRGAFTARAVSGLIQAFGLIRPEHENLISTLLHLYFKERETQQQKDDYRSASEDIRLLFADAQRREPWVHFIGVWDTVASIGLPPFDRTITSDPTVRNKRFNHVRHALALDEYRVPFTPRLYKEDNFDEPGRSLKQVWFPGAHCDVGGGYAESPATSKGGCGLSNRTLEWMRSEAAAVGLRVTPTCPQSTTLDRVHSETHSTAAWTLAGLAQRTIKRDSQIAPIVPALEFPTNTVWNYAQNRAGMFVAIAIYLVAMALTVVAMRHAWPANFDAWHQSFGELAIWHAQPLMPPFAGLTDPVSVAPGASPRTALMFELIAALCALLLLARFASGAFAWVARLRQPTQPASAWLERLGKAPKVLAVAAAANHLGALLVVMCAPWAWHWVCNVLKILSAAAWWVQWPALLGVGILVGWGAFARLSHRRP